jgi:cyanate permease
MLRPIHCIYNIMDWQADTGMVAITSVVLSLLLQMNYVLLVSITVKHTGWLRYITVLFTGINFVGWLAVVFFSVQQKQYWILALAIGLASTVCLGSIKYWCRYEKELVT